jgi:hypothetical protein
MVLVMVRVDVLVMVCVAVCDLVWVPDFEGVVVIAPLVWADTLEDTEAVPVEVSDEV